VTDIISKVIARKGSIIKKLEEKVVLLSGSLLKFAQVGLSLP
jgi:hypothetical protein